VVPFTIILTPGRVSPVCASFTVPEIVFWADNVPVRLKNSTNIPESKVQNGISLKSNVNQFLY
jgi:hypothetical protein